MIDIRGGREEKSPQCCCSPTRYR